MGGKFSIKACATLVGMLISTLWVGALEAQLQPTTTTVVCTSLATCTSANLNVNAATLRRPTTDALGNAHVGVFVMHSFGGYRNFAVCNALAQRGFTTLCADSIWTGRQHEFYGFEQHVPGIRDGINYLKNLSATATHPGISKVIIWGHSAGAPMMSFYQNVAENGLEACQGREKILPCVTTNLQNLPKADGIIIFDPQEGPGVWTFNLDPAVLNNECAARDSRLDMFMPENGLTDSTPGESAGDYSKQFLKQFFLNQAKRNRELYQEALDLLDARRITTGNPNDMGDSIPFTVVGVTTARPWNYDLELRRSTKKSHILLDRHGNRPVQIVKSVRVPNGDGPDLSPNCEESTETVNVHVWLGAKTFRTKPAGANGTYLQTENDILGIDWDSNNNNVLTNFKHIGKRPNGTQKTTPILIISNGAYYFIVPGEMYYNAAYSKDKTYAISEGAVHNGGPCADCARVILNDPNLTNAQANAYWTDPQGNGPADRSWNFMAEWLGARY
jgi:hypothetical protein